jgi:hypothetical protein
MRQIMLVAAAVGLAAAFYLLLIDTTYPPDLYAGAVIVALAGAAFAASLEEDERLMASPRTWLRELIGALARVPRDTVRLTVVAVRQLLHPQPQRGQWVTRSVGPDQASDRARREILGSLAPGEIVTGHDTESSEMLVHRIIEPR